MPGALPKSLQIALPSSAHTIYKCIQKTIPERRSKTASAIAAQSESKDITYMNMAGLPTHQNTLYQYQLG
jgi:hypothetical protein